MKKKVPVSVVIPCYRCSETVKRAVDSVSRQTYSPLEVILVDDGNIDNTGSTLLEIQNSYGEEWIKIIRFDSNSGPSVARNAAWEMASGYYIAFLDADDAWAEKKLEIQYTIMERNPGCIISGHACINSKWKESKERILNRPVPIKKVSIWPFLISNRFKTPSVMVRSNLEYRFRPHKSYSEDYLLWMEILLNEKGTALFIDLPLAILFKPSFGVSGLSADLSKMEKEELSNFKKFYKTGRLSSFIVILVMVFSYIKFIRRKIIVKHRKNI